jgi:phage host-nuclease inhibitor protein Gam
MNTSEAVTHAEALEAAEAYRKAELELSAIDLRIKERTAEVMAKYEARMNELNEQKALATTALENYVSAHREDVLGKNKSGAFAGLNIGYRKATAHLTLVGKRTWETVLEALCADATMKRRFVQTKQEIDKNALKKAEPETLKQIGVKLEQPENFFVKL